MAATERRRQKCIAAIKHGSIREGREEAATTSAGSGAAASTTRAARATHACGMLLMHLSKTLLEFLALRKVLFALLGESSLEFLALLGENSLEFLVVKMLFMFLLVLTPDMLENAGGALHCLKQHLFISFRHSKLLGIVEVTSDTECGSKLSVRNGEIRLPAKW
jgi:hypothetical protein